MITWIEDKGEDYLRGINFLGIKRYEATAVMIKGFFYPGIIKYALFSKRIIWKHYFTKYKSATRKKAYEYLKEAVLGVIRE